MDYQRHIHGVVKDLSRWMYMDELLKYLSIQDRMREDRFYELTGLGHIKIDETLSVNENRN